MKKRLFFQLPENASAEAVNAFRGALVLLLAVTFNLISAIRQAMRTGAGQTWMEAGVILAFMVCIFFSIVLIRRQSVERGVNLLVASFLITLALRNSLTAGMGMLFGVIAATITMVLATYTMPSRRAVLTSVIGVLAGIFMVLFDLYAPPYRQSTTISSVPIAALVVTLIFVILMGWRAWQSGRRSLIGKILAPIIAVTLVLMLSLAGYMYASARLRDRAETEDSLNRMEQIVSSQLDNLQTLALGLATQTVNSPEVQAAFATRDRELLTELTLPTFKILQSDFAVKQVQFFLPPATSFLRLHQLDRFGDDLSSIRATFLKMNETQAAVGGPEIGRGGLGVRGVVPIFYKGRYVGGLEVGLDIGPAFLENLKKQYGVEAQLMLEKQAATASTFEGATGETAGPTEDLLFQASTLAEPFYADASVYPRVLAGESVISTVNANDRTYAVISFPLKDYSGKVIGVLEVLTDRTDVLAAQTRNLWITIMASLAVMILGSFLITRVISYTIQPIEALTETASAVAGGDLKRQAPVQSEDEIGILATAFNSMTVQLRGLFETMEQRIAARTRNLELAAEVGRAVSQLRALDVMLKDACELILKEFDLYYVQVYLADPSQHTLTLEAGTGSVGAQLRGRGHSLPINVDSINGRAVLEKRPVVISDVSQSTTFHQNPLLPNTRGEMAVPLIVADKVVGVLDMQSSEPGVLNKEILPAFEALAGQLAVAIQNESLLEETERARVQVEAQARRLVREGWDEHLDAIHKPEQIGFVFGHNTVTPLAEMDETQLPEGGNAISVPIAVTGEALGSLVVEIGDETSREQAGELVNVIARQVAQQIENLRLLESAERYRQEAEQAARLQTIEGWQEYIASRPAESLGYLYDTKEVHPKGNDQGEDAPAFATPLKAREETIGKLSVQGLTHEDQESVELVNIIAERLGAHIESLRLFEETRRGQVELDKRARQLAAVAEISTVSSKELDVQKMLESVVHLTQRQFGLYHAHVFLYDENTGELQIAACGWKEGDEHEGTHGTTTILIDQEQSLVARAARTKEAVIVNNVFVEPGWLPNPLLPDTASELAVPLVIGNRVLGVLDVQSDHVNAFTEEDANIQTTLASQVATALQNARSFAQAQKQAERESTLNVIGQKIQSATSVEAVLQIAARELGRALGAPLTVAQLSMRPQPNGGNDTDR